jgi:hypothetical protein
MRQSNALETYMHTMSAASARPADPEADETRLSLQFWPPLGTVQGRIVALAGMASHEGMHVDEIARRANRPGGPSTDDVLDTLSRRGIVEPLAGGRYRLAEQYRRLLTSSREATEAPPHRAAHA